MHELLHVLLAVRTVRPQDQDLSQFNWVFEKLTDSDSQYYPLAESEAAAGHARTTWSTQDWKETAGYEQFVRDLSLNEFNLKQILPWAK